MRHWTRSAPLRYNISDFFSNLLGLSQEQQLKGFLDTILQGRGQTANEVADAALFLCSGHASAITGQALNVDGGAAFY